MAGGKGATRDALTVLVAVVLAAFIFIASLSLAGALPGADAGTGVDAVLPTTSSLTAGSRVTMAGARVGQVREVRRHGSGSLVEMEIREDAVLPIPEDSRVTLRQRTPVGENYLEITPGRSSRALEEGGTLPIGQADEYVEVDEILSVFQGGARKAARRLIQGAGRAVDGQGPAVNRTLEETTEVVRHGAAVLSLLHEDRRHVASLVDRFGAIATALGERRAAVEDLAARGLIALKALGARDDALAATLRELPSTLRQVSATGGRLQATADTAAPVLREATTAVKALDPAVGQLRPAAAEARRVLRELDRGAQPLTALVDDVRSAAAPLTDALPQVRRTICQVAPMLRYARPYAKDLVAPIIGLGSASNSYDAIGHLVRLSGVINENTLVGLPPDVSAAAHTLLRAGVFEKSSGVTWDPYPEPGMVGRSRASQKPSLLGPKALAEAGWNFPRVTADC